MGAVRGEAGLAGPYGGTEQESPDLGGWTRYDSHELTAALVLFDGHRIKLTGPERKAAVRLAAQAGMTSQQLRQRLGIDAETARRWVKRAGVELATEDPFAAWCRRYIERRRKR